MITKERILYLLKGAEQEMCHGDYLPTIPERIELCALALKSMAEKRYCPCGGIILADTDECKVPVCIECCVEISKSYLNMDENYNEGFKRGMDAAKVEWPTGNDVWRKVYRWMKQWSSGSGSPMANAQAEVWCRAVIDSVDELNRTRVSREG